MRRVVVLVAALVVVLGAIAAVLILQPRGPSLAVGECFDVPEAIGDVPTATERQCSEPHTGEVFLVERLSLGDAYPGEVALNDIVFERCVPAFASYTGEDLFEAEDMDVGAYLPSSDAWATGDRNLICFATRADLGSSSGSVRRPAGS